MYDVAIIGGGICGCSLLYALSKYQLRIVLIEKSNDVGVGTTKANSAILHAGYDPRPGSLMARYNVRGNLLAKQLCRQLDVLMEECGSLVVGFDKAERPEIEKLYQQGLANGVPGLQLLEGEVLQALEPHLSKEALFALYAPTAAIVNPWELALAQGEMAVINGAEVQLDTEVTAISREKNHFALTAGGHKLNARFVVNAAGIDAAQVAAMAGAADFSIHPNRGQYYLLDKSQGQLVHHIIFQCPTVHGKGVLVAPTVHGNLIVGPNSEAASSLATTAEGMAFVKEKALNCVPDINFRESIRNFAGLRAATEVDDFIVEESHEVDGFFNIAGIKSPGLTAAVAIAEDMVLHLQGAGLKLKEKDHFENSRRILRFSHLNDAERAEAIAQNPLYGQIVCRCETVTEGEVLDALRRPLPPRSIDAVKRRCTPGMGRCQGGFCGPRVQALIARELKLNEAEVPQDRQGMDIVLAPTKDPAFYAQPPTPSKEDDHEP